MEGEPRTTATGGDGRGNSKWRRRAGMTEAAPRHAHPRAFYSSAVVDMCTGETAVSADDVDENPKHRSACCCVLPLAGVELMMNITAPYIAAKFPALAIASN
uniref:Uncharacterized protein n=1 Tax=Oryza glumipatula TaxID=40148 RepID=A0A0D9ZHR6_9ORYZ